ncbi:hypothetical protein [Streptomyces sp. CT34]|uniref:hypothetical protein n=1 Tax=Streptomyces sp. CT34 TaxID=1553907 RepID=UPI0006916A5D|nr:hypothetical protein [Streptomyces sp. CT34]
MLMSRDARLSGHCGHEHCGKPMNPDAGHLPELILPLIGGRVAGKTQLMAAMVKSLENTAEDGGSAIRLVDPELTASQRVLNEVLEIQGHTRPTQKTLPRAHSFVLGTGRAERLGLRNLVKAMDLEFGEVRFFCTAAVADQMGLVEPSTAAFAEWCLRE